MKNICVFIIALFISSAVIAQEHKMHHDKKENLGQSVSEVNETYRTRMQALKSDETLTRKEKKLRKKELKEMKKVRIREIKESAGKHEMKDHRSEKDRDEKEIKDKREKKVKKEKKVKN